MFGVDPEAIFHHGGAFEEHGDRMHTVVANWQVHLGYMAGVAGNDVYGEQFNQGYVPGVHSVTDGGLNIGNALDYAGKNLRFTALNYHIANHNSGL